MNADQAQYTEYLGFDDWDDDDVERFDPSSSVGNDSYYQKYGFRKNRRPYRPEETVERLKHIIEEFSYIQDQVAHGKDLYFSNSRRGGEVRRIAERCIEKIAEASAGLHSDYKERFKVPWRELNGMRNIVAHKYHDVDNKIVWDAMTTHIPEFLMGIGIADTNPGETPWVPADLR